jgi:Glycosyl transferase family 11
MFQVAFAHAASRTLGTRFVHTRPPRFVPTRPPFWVSASGPPLWKFFELGDWGRIAHRWRCEAEFRTLHRSTPRVDVPQDADAAATLAGLRDDTTYVGFFQSEEWFAGFEAEVRQIFTPLARHRRTFEKYRRPAPYACMHVRRTDYIETGVWALPTSFFLDALAAAGVVDRMDIVVVTDDPPFVARELGELPRLVCEPRPAMSDLQLLAHADVVITSNSSFSWWGAWLNVKPEVRVFAPRHWLGFAAGVDEPRNTIPARWATVPVRDPPLRAVD